MKQSLELKYEASCDLHTSDVTKMSAMPYCRSWTNPSSSRASGSCSCAAVVWLSWWYLVVSSNNKAPCLAPNYFSLGRHRHLGVVHPEPLVAKQTGLEADGEEGSLGFSVSPSNGPFHADALQMSFFPFMS